MIVYVYGGGPNPPIVFSDILLIFEVERREERVRRKCIQDETISWISTFV